MMGEQYHLTLSNYIGESYITRSPRCFFRTFPTQEIDFYFSQEKGYGQPFTNISTMLLPVICRSLEAMIDVKRGNRDMDQLAIAQCGDQV
jgi:hypothetical protein